MPGTNQRSMTVNQLPLPARLVELIESGRWAEKPDVEAVRRVWHFTHLEDFGFLGVDGMARETEGLKKIYDRPETGANGLRARDIYGLTCSEAGEPLANRPGLLDVRLAVCISVNYDEEGFCLDYRPVIDRPRVVAGPWSEGHMIAEWQVVAKDFESFAEMIGL